MAAAIGKNIDPFSRVFALISALVLYYLSRKAPVAIGRWQGKVFLNEYKSLSYAT